MDKHTPTPWKVAGTEIWAGSHRVTMGSGSYDVKSSEEKKANAAFIVRAVNCHEELLKSLKLCLAIVDHESKGVYWTQTIEDAKQAIAKAEWK